MGAYGYVYQVEPISQQGEYYAVKIMRCSEDDDINLENL